MRHKKNIINLFEDVNIYSIKQVVSIDTEDDLNQFWDLILKSESSTHGLVHSFFVQFYNFVLAYIQNKDINFFEITIEEADKYCYFTIHNKKISLLFKNYLKKTSLNFIYKNKKLSIRLNKLKFEKNINKINEKNEKRTKNLIKSVTQVKKQKIIKPYDFIEHDDLKDLIKLNDDMQELIFLIKKHNLTEDIFISLRSLISLFCLTLRYYEKIHPIATTITEFSNLLNLHRDKFINIDKDELELIAGFVNNIDTWLENLFIKGGGHLYFMDNSMKADLGMISQIINPNDDLVKEDLDDIFDF